ncbi:MAG TPA: hypothetical protein VFK42_03855 [Acidimicrobiales bacterium]|nr:hypothetical protein [Acidimicrobiales bacterium]
MRSRTVAIAVALVSSLSLVAAACGDDDGGAIDTSSTTTTATPAVTPTTRADEGGIDPMSDASTSPVSVPVPADAAGGAALLSAVRASRHEGYDRVVFEFTTASSLPGYSVSYVDEPVTEDGSGKEVDVAGDHVLLVRMEHASGVDLTKESAPQTYTGPTRFTPGTPEVTELVRTGDFEAVLSWAIGVHDKAAFRVLTLGNPARLVVDVQNH